MDIQSELSSILSGEVLATNDQLEKYSHDTSLFEVKPKLIIKPKSTEDVCKAVNFVRENKQEHKDLSITARSAGTCMSGGAINDSIIMVFDEHMTNIGEVEGTTITAEPGAHYLEFEKKTMKRRMIMPSYPASRDLCAVGGMVANNAGGEKSLTYGKVENFVKQLEVVLSDGNKYVIKPLNREQLDLKMSQSDYEGRLYSRIFHLINNNYDEIIKAKPNVTKNSTGYKLWDVWNKETGIFDLTQLFIGSQGTLGIMTKIKFRLVKSPKHSGVLAGYARDLEHMTQIIDILKSHNPTTIEAFDQYTVKFAFKFFLKFRKGIGWWGLIKLAFSLIPDAFILMRGMPKMIFMASFDDDDLDVIKQKIEQLKEDIDIKHWHITTEEAETESKSERFWMMRRKSFNLLRENVGNNLHTAPFIDDLVVPTDQLKQFWPQLEKIMKKYDLLYTMAGHLGDGNFHIIPLMNLSKQTERDKIEPCLKEVIGLVKKHKGVISGEHNDGLIRGPFLKEMYGNNIYTLFKETKRIFDPQNIFNPHKKTDANWQYAKDHIRSHF